MTDAELIQRFEDASLSGDEFTHARHVRVAWIYLQRHGREGAISRMTAGLRTLVVRLGKPDKYDEALTRAWIEVIDTARASHPEARTFDELATACPYLLESSTVRTRS